MQEANGKTQFVRGAVIIAAAFLVTAGVLAWFQHSSQAAPLPSPTAQPTSSSTATAFDWSNGTCVGKKGTVPLTASPMNLQDIAYISPMGTMSLAHVTPIDHLYYFPTNLKSAPDSYPVYAPADGTIVTIGRRVQSSGVAYRIIIEHSCSFWSLFDLTTSVSPAILSQVHFPAESAGYSEVHVRIPVKAGEEIAKIGGQSLDFGLYDANTTLPGFAVPASYVGEPWKIHTVDPFTFFTEPLKTQQLAKDVRQVAPRGGKIDYDQNGKLVGTWFKQGSGGYIGKDVTYWTNHLSLAYDAIDPSHLIFSLGDFKSQPQQFAVKGNLPDPATVGVGTLVKYTLVPWQWYTGSGQVWDGQSYASGIHAINADNQVAGTLLVQLLGDQTLKMEVFPGKDASSVAGFDGSALTYSR